MEFDSVRSTHSRLFSCFCFAFRFQCLTRVCFRRTTGDPEAPDEEEEEKERKENPGEPGEKPEDEEEEEKKKKIKKDDEEE